MGKPVIENFSMKMCAGEIVAVRGPSGAGKSTLLAIIAGLHKNYEGSVSTGGKIALVTQENSLLPFLTIFQNTVLLSKITGEKADGERARLLLKKLGLQGLEEKYPSELSGGELRRGQLAQALYFEPDILLADEPFSALDIDTKSGVMSLFSDIRNKRKITTVLVTHDSAEAEKIGGKQITMGREGAGK